MRIPFSHWAALAAAMTVGVAAGTLLAGVLAPWAWLMLRWVL